MKLLKPVFFALSLFTIFSCSNGPEFITFTENVENRITVVEKNEGKGFFWPYFLYIPDEIKYENPPLLVSTNNCSRSDDFDFVYNEAKKDFLSLIEIADEYGIPCVLCALPRFSNNFPGMNRGENDAWVVNVQALTRTALLTDVTALKRIDEQVKYMILDAFSRLDAKGIQNSGKCAMFGFSASADFANRFSILQPELVELIIAGDPSDWYTLPISEYKGRTLRYPIGVSDIIQLTGQEFNRQEYNDIAKFFFTGDSDAHDPILYIDNIDYEDRMTFFRLFGTDIMEKYYINEKLLREAKCNFEFRVYPGTAHQFSDEMREDALDFFRRYINSRKSYN